MQRIHQLLCGQALLAILAAVAHAAEPPQELARWLLPQVWQRDVETPIVSLGEAGAFDDMHIFAPAVAEENRQFSMWYCGSQGTPGNRVFRLGLATSNDGRQFDKMPGNPVFEFGDGRHSVLTPALLRRADGTVLRENGKLRMWFAAATLGKGGLHTLHETTSPDGIHWAEPSPSLLDNVYCPTVLKTDDGYQMWFSDVSRRPWVIRHAASKDGSRWDVTEDPVLRLSQPWEAEVLVYPTVLRVGELYLMWYGSYDNAVRRETTAIGFAVSRDGLKWHKHPQNPALRPDRTREWESNYVGSGCVARLADGSFRYWYASRREPPFKNLYFAINTARWPGPAGAPLRLPPQKGDTGVLGGAHLAADRSVDVLEVIDERNAVVRAWYSASDHLTFIDLWLQGADTGELTAGGIARLPQTWQVTGNKLFSTDCGQRSLPLLEPVERER